jgi:hypothetical protein
VAHPPVPVGPVADVGMGVGVAVPAYPRVGEGLALGSAVGQYPLVGVELTTGAGVPGIAVGLAVGVLADAEGLDDAVASWDACWPA